MNAERRRGARASRDHEAAHGPERTPDGRVHRGVWKVLERVLLIPPTPPEAPPGRSHWTRTFRPDEAFLRYLMVVGALRALAMVAVAFGFGAVMVVAAEADSLSVIGASVLVVVVTIPAAASLLGVRLRYDATWYVMTDRALRNRRGIWVLRENTVSFDNVQNLRVRQGPIQRWLGIQDLVVETAASGSGGSEQGSTAQKLVVEGIRDARELRDRIAVRMRRGGSGLGERRRGARSAPPSGSLASTPAPAANRGREPAANLGPEPAAGPGLESAVGLGPEHLALLRQIRDEVRRLAERIGPR